MSLELGNQIRKYRINLEMTQDNLADKLNVSRQTISKWELERSYPDIESLITLSRTFDVSVDLLLGLSVGDKSKLNVNKIEKKRVTQLLKEYLMKTNEEKLQIMMDQISVAYSDPEVKNNQEVKEFLFNDAKVLDKNGDFHMIASKLCKQISWYSFENPKNPLKALATLYYQVKPYANGYDGVAMATMMLPVWFG